MSICLNCRRREECDLSWKDDTHMVDCTGHEEYRTNFERITESPEKLAKFIEDVTLICYGCKVVFAENCPHRKRNGVMFCDKEECAKWLNQESKE